MVMPFVLFGKYPFSRLKADKVVELSKNVDLMIEGTVVDVEHFYVHKKEKRLLKPEEITDQNMGKIWPYTKLSVEISSIYKSKNNISDVMIDVWITGAIIPLNSKDMYAEVSNSAYPFLDAKDVMIMGLKRNKKTKTISSIIEEYKYGYHFHKGNQLQFPSSDKMIREVEDGEVKKAELKYYRKLAKENKKGNDVENLPSLNQFEVNLLDAEIEKEKKIKTQKEMIKDLKSALRREYE